MRKGDVLVELDGEQARADLAVAQAALTESTSQLKRSRELYETKVLSEQQIEQIEATHAANLARVASARSRLNDTVIRAPFNGRVGLRRVSVGSLVEPGTVITTLDDIGTIKLDFTVPETVVASMKPGLALQATSVAYPGQRVRRARRERRFARRPRDAFGDGARDACRIRRGCSSPACS